MIAGSRRQSSSGPALSETFAIALTALGIATVVVVLLGDYPRHILVFGDNRAYLAIAEAIRSWNFERIDPKHFWGFPYTVALASVLTRSVPVALVAVSIMASVVSVGIAWRLWGGVVASLFAVLSSDWIQRSILGGAEPVFMVLLLGSFLSARREHWIVAGILAALASTVRPVGVLAVIAIAIVSVRKRDWKNAAGVALAAIAIGILYVVPQKELFGDVAASYRQYQTSDWVGGPPVGLPFVALARGAAAYAEQTANEIQIAAWVVVVLAAAGATAANRNIRETLAEFPVEAVFAISYTIFLFTYNAPQWAWGEFPRFAIPILPFVYVVLTRNRKVLRSVLWSLAVAGGLFAGASAIGVRRVLQLLIA